MKTANSSKEAGNIRVLAAWGPTHRMELWGARHPAAEEVAQYADWYRARCLMRADNLDIVELAHYKFGDACDLEDTDGRSRYAFDGPNNTLWIVSPEEEAQIIRSNNERAAAAAAAEAAKVPAPPVGHLEDRGEDGLIWVDPDGTERR